MDHDPSASPDCIRMASTIGDLIGDRLPYWLDQGWLASDGATLKLTRQGLLLSDSLWPEFL